MSISLESGDRFVGRYDVQRLLGEGHRKCVYLARDTRMHRDVALALLKPVAVEADPDAAEHETKVLGAIGRHENIVRLYDRDPESDPQYMVFEYLSGGTLAQYLADTQHGQQAVSVDHLLRLARQLSRALSHLHQRGIVHRDLCPSNVWLDERLGGHLGDFDTAILVDDPPRTLRPLTNQAYASPEELAGELLDARSDLFSLGAVLLNVCGGAGSRGVDRELHRLRPDLPTSFTDLLGDLLAPSPDDRPSDAETVLKSLDQARTGLVASGGARHRSGDLPEPDAAELKSSAGVRAADYAAGDVIDGRFEVLALLGEGGFSKVYRVRDKVEEEERAFKLFHSAAGYEAVRREIGALRKVSHPRIVEVFWADKTDAGDWYLVSEYVVGETLDKYASGESHLRDREAVDVILDVLEALVAIHPDSALIEQLEHKEREGGLSLAEYRQLLSLKERGLVHRDVKPSNVVLTRTGAKLLDFNIASRVGESVKTQSGTPAYQAPDAELTLWDVSTDLFAVGVMLYELVCNGQHPYPGKRPMVGREVIEPRTFRAELGADLAAFLLKACAAVRSERFTTATEMRDELRGIRAAL